VLEKKKLNPRHTAENGGEGESSFVVAGRGREKPIGMQRIPFFPPMGEKRKI